MYLKVYLFKLFINCDSPPFKVRIRHCWKCFQFNINLSPLFKLFWVSWLVGWVQHWQGLELRSVSLPTFWDSILRMIRRDIITIFNQPRRECLLCSNYFGKIFNVENVYLPNYHYNGIFFNVKPTFLLYCYWLVGFNVGLELWSGLLLSLWDSIFRVVQRYVITVSILNGWNSTRTLMSQRSLCEVRHLQLTQINENSMFSHHLQHYLVNKNKNYARKLTFVFFRPNICWKM